MKIEFTGRHIEVTPALRSHVEEHFAKIEHLFDGKPPNPHVIIEVEGGGRHRSEIIMNWRNEVFTANSTNADMYKSLTQTITKIAKQARRLKDKVIDKSHRAQKTAVIATPPEPADMPSRPQIIRSNGFGTKPMTTDEALLELESAEYPFYAFRSAESGDVSVIFKRKDGNYGLMQP
jgi:putative sigma-54 modulation protein